MSASEGTLWQLLEKRKVQVESIAGQITKAPLIGYEWFDADKAPEVYEPDAEGIMWGIPEGNVKAYIHQKLKPEVPPELLAKCVHVPSS